MKEWDTNFVYDELNNNVNKDKLMIDLLDGKDNENLFQSIRSYLNMENRQKT